MSYLETLHHSMVCHQPEAIDTISTAWDDAETHFAVECNAYVVGW